MPNSKYGRTSRERLFSRLTIDPVTGCVVWTGPVDHHGYALTYFEGRTQRPHRVMYQLFAGPIPDGLVLDHLCRNPPCCNVAHLEAVTNRENIRRGIGRAAENMSKTHCPQGHPYDDANTFWRNNGARLCRICHREGVRRRRAYKNVWTRRRREQERSDKCVVTEGSVPGGIPSGLGWPVAVPRAVTDRYIRIPWTAESTGTIQKRQVRGGNGDG